MIKLFEMFSGYGGASFALKKANIPFKCIGYSEIDKYAIKIYNQNHLNIRNYGDCSKINTNDLPDFNLLTGGFPCQDVSIIGDRDLSKGRTNLYKEIIRIANDKKPKYMLLENVKGLMSMKINEKLLYKQILNNLKNIGYGVILKILNSKDYRIPQNRERVWFICKYNGWEFNEFKDLKKERKIININNFLQKQVDNKYYLTKQQEDKIFNGEKIRLIKVIAPTLILGRCYTNYETPLIIDSKKYKDENKKRIYKNIIPTLMGRKRTDEVPILCITEAQGRQGNSTEFIKTSLRIGRRLTPKECFRLMGFVNDEIILDGISDSSLYKIVGNGWDINLVSKIFQNIFTKEDIEISKKEEEELNKEIERKTKKVEWLKCN